MTREQVRAARNFFDVDNYFTAPLHGFKDAEDYWQKSSSKQFLSSIAVPTMVLNTANDPIVPVDSLATAAQVSAAVTLHYTENGGHVGFLTTRQSGDEMKHFAWMPDQIFGFFDANSQ